MKPTATHVAQSAAVRAGPTSRAEYGKLLVAFAEASARARITYAENRKAQAEFVAARDAVASARPPI